MRKVYRDPGLASGYNEILISGRWTFEDLPHLASSMDWWKSRKLPVVLIGPTPEYGVDLPRLLARAIIEKNAALPMRYLLPEPRELDRAMEAMAAAHGVHYVSIYRLMCAQHCPTMAKGEPIAFDYGHLTKQGSILAANLLETAPDLMAHPAEAATSMSRGAQAK
jgi:hypothetical protein